MHTCTHHAHVHAHLHRFLVCSDPLYSSDTAHVAPKREPAQIGCVRRVIVSEGCKADEEPCPCQTVRAVPQALTLPAEHEQELERPSTQMKQNRARQLGNGTPPPWWGDQPVAESPKPPHRGRTPQRNHNPHSAPRQPTGGLPTPSESDRHEPFTPSRHPAVAEPRPMAYSPQWSTEEPRGVRHGGGFGGGGAVGGGGPHGLGLGLGLAGVDRGGGYPPSASGAGAPPEHPAGTSGDETTAMLLELSQKLDDTRAELRKTEDQLLASESALLRERETHGSEQEAALQLLRQAQEALELERDTRSRLEGELASARDSEARWRAKVKQLETADGAAGRGEDGSERRHSVSRGGKGRERADGRGTRSNPDSHSNAGSQRRAPRPPDSRGGRDHESRRADHSSRARPSPPMDNDDGEDNSHRTSRHVHFETAAEDGGHTGRPRGLEDQIAAETAAWGVDDEVIGPKTGGGGGWEAAEYEEAAPTGRMRQCPHCPRMFAEDRVARHAKACLKLKKSKRKPVDPTAMRTRGTEAEEFVRRAARKKGGGAAPSNPVKKTNWREKSEAFREAMRASRA